MDAFMLALFGIGCSLIGGVLTRLYDKQQKEIDSVSEEKKRLAEQLLAAVNEGASHKYSEKPRDFEHIHRLLSDMKEWDEDFSKRLSKFFKNWIKKVETDIEFMPSHEHDPFLDEYSLVVRKREAKLASDCEEIVKKLRSFKRKA